MTLKEIGTKREQLSIHLFPQWQDKQNHRSSKTAIIGLTW